MEIHLSFLVGLVFVFTSLLKTFYSRLFIHHVNRLQVFPDKLGPLLAILFIELEVGLGMGLILRVYPQQLVPFSLVLILVMSCLTFWAVHSERVEDCGCYGSFIRLSLPQTLVLNGFYGLLLGIDYYLHDSTVQTPEWKLYLLVGIVLGVHFLAKRSVFNPLWDLSGVNVGKRWRSGWFSSEVAVDKAPKVLIILLDDQCSQCLDWRDRLSVMEPESVTKEILVLVSSNKGATSPFIDDLPFPAFAIEGLRIRLLQGQLPMAVLVENGIITNVWKRSFPSREAF